MGRVVTLIENMARDERANHDIMEANPALLPITVHILIYLFFLPTLLHL